MYRYIYIYTQCVYIYTYIHISYIDMCIYIYIYTHYSSISHYIPWYSIISCCISQCWFSGWWSLPPNMQVCQVNLRKTNMEACGTCCNDHFWSEAHPLTPGTLTWKWVSKLFEKANSLSFLQDGAPKMLNWFISGWILWFMVDIPN